MTSVTIPSSSGPLHGGYSSSSSVTEEISNNKADFDAARTVKRSLSVTSSESCKKRRKQSTPIRISTTEAEQSPTSNSLEGKPAVPSPEPNLRCPVCQLCFDYSEQLQSHMVCEHPLLECKKEPEEHSTTPSAVPFLEHSDTSLGLHMARPEMQWISDIQSKDWMSSAMPSLPFNPANPMFMSLPQFTQPENIPMKPIRIFNPDAYCDLCNKEFCNKYFLKTHKANKHGIYTDAPTSEPVQMQNPVAIIASKLPNSVPTVESSAMKNEPKTPVNVINPFSNIFSNPFSKQIGSGLSEGEVHENVATSNGLSSSSDSDKIFPDDQPAEEYPSPSNTQTESTSLKTDPDGIFYESSSKLSPDHQGRELDLSYRLRRFGVMNPKAFCEICCKEYCNKYFLRTHKLKRHGIYIPDDKEKDIKTESLANFPSSNNVQTSPLNLIMTEQSDRKTTSPSNICCDICGIKFQNASLAQLHNVSVHGKMYPKDQEQSDSSVQEVKKLPEMFKTPEKSLNAEAISEDLQKLQTMILQLNDLDVSKVTTTTCNVCNKEFENRFYLHAHMMTEHGMLLEDIGDVERTGESEGTSNNNTMCDICGKEVHNADEMTKHVMEFHTNNQAAVESNKDDYNGFGVTDKGSTRISISSGHIPERRVSMNVTPTSSYCEICNKELCNKYFMKTHMQRMHGIEIENGAQIGGVVCDICNKELCSKYFLRVHKHNTHGIVEYGSNLLPPRKSDGDPPPPQPSAVAPEPDPALKPGDLADLSHRYFTHFTEVCTICCRRFRSTKWLKAHLVTDHGQAGADKWTELEHQLQQGLGGHTTKSSTAIKIEGSSPSLKVPNGGQETTQQKVGVGIQNVISSLLGIDETSSKVYQCSYCPFTTPLLPLLFVHERSHSLNSEGMPVKCPVCPQSFMEREQLQRHLFSQHPFLSLPSVSKEENSICKENSEDAETDNEQGQEQGQGHGQGQAQGQGQGQGQGLSAPASTSVRQNLTKNKKQSSSPVKIKQVELSSEIGQSLKDVAKRMQWPATYAIPQGQNQAQDQDQDDSGFASKPGYVMQAFLLEESTTERRVMPSVVFLPMLQKQPAPITVTFTLTPA